MKLSFDILFPKVTRKDLKPSFVILCAAIVVSLVGFNVWNWSTEEVWFKCQALTLFFLTWAFERYVDRNDKLLNSVLNMLVWWMLGNVYDEFLGDPLAWNWSELVFAVIAAVSSFLTYHGVRFHHLWLFKKLGIKYLRNVWRRK